MKTIINTIVMVLLLTAPVLANSYNNEEKSDRDNNVEMKISQSEMNELPIFNFIENEEEAVFECSVTIDCGNGSSATGTASNCATAGKIAGAGCDASLEQA
ncbi:hypothetical protein MM239_02150 [Belliella sp. DSM 111904]|uniref:NVEALA protein n=1 Tax=Belliella filtrata TaxID=2923435 RepID=A0ABS9UVI6_9BACT|nr:hypothetical protein [Belliella filtrata]MCH7408183.1 hypothetical protein [Belliella filtrata]